MNGSCLTLNRKSIATNRKSIATLIAAIVVAVLGWSAPSVFADSASHQRHEEPIVGLWQVTFTDTATKKVVSYVWNAWHSDRTEIENDTGNILSGNVCQGTWVPLGHRTYGLRPPAFLFADPTHPEFGWTEENEGQFVGASCVILERITVDQGGNNYRGPGLIKCVAGADPFDPTATVLSTENLKITGKRVTVDVSQLPSP